MTLQEMIAKAVERRASKVAERATVQTERIALRSILEADNARELTADEAARVVELRTQLTALDADIDAQTARIDELTADQARDDAVSRLATETHGTGAQRQAPQVGGARTGNEERVYHARSGAVGRSFFRDADNARKGNWEAQVRLQKHGEQIRADLAAAGIETRAMSTSNGGSLVVPQYLPDMFAPALRSGRPFANSLQHLPLPSEGMTITLPRLTTATTVGVQAAQNTAVPGTDAAVTDLTIPVVTVAGQASLSRQLIERGDNVDQLIYGDLANAYAAQLDLLTLIGSGTAGQPLGVLNTAGTLQQTVFTASVTPAAFYSKVAGAIGAVTGQGAGISPKVIVMHPRRWAWLTAQSDNTGRPLVVATAQFNSPGVNTNPGAYGGDQDPINGLTYVGTFQGLPVITDSNIPVTRGTDTVQDVVLVVDTAKVVLWEDGDGMPRQLEFEQTLGSQLTTNLIVYGYVAFTAGRYPGATALVGGSDGAGFGLQAPSF